MRQFCKLVIASVLAVSFAACSSHPVRVDYDKEYAQGIKFKNGSWENAKNLGSVRANAGGAIWKDCKDLAIASVEEIAYKAKDMGANAIGDISFEHSNNSSPTCKKRWGYFLLWPFVLTPLFADVPVTATAYQTGAGAAKTSGLYQLPLSVEAKNEIVQNMIR